MSVHCPICVSVKNSTSPTGFPPYKWRMAACHRCRCHLGWSFHHPQENTDSPLFFGLIVTRLRQRETIDTEEEELPDPPTFTHPTNLDAFLQALMRDGFHAFSDGYTAQSETDEQEEEDDEEAEDQTRESENEGT
eukprot:c6510_g1_i1.p1 GENE.c6510_g1_i1~~c6510_g1_i1.p1  ORF type:complete len:135 (+),score=18.80 c6510_g1_i1:257-661(+)